ncbi:pancreatic triacylglycerol lipase-like isoform X2 [Homarus americanus]|uniref:pancreatic triacylglycerol lipase-like isoform X2 n=1 Tax=Homarus americanus TaxID=6706 RepID=UPI001C4904E1|nr:pancreatic triacylglycerol lipase-like isoform X2 [Homarus americanus]
MKVVVVVMVLVGGTVAAVPAWRRSIPLDLTNKLTTGTEWCDDVLGCLDLNNDWYTTTRPINVLPLTRAHINTRFLLHTRAEPAESEKFYISADKDAIDATTFDPAKPIKIICHGFIDTGNTVWLKDMAKAFLSYGDYNVIRVNWGDGSLPMYFQATANTRVVGLEIAYLVNFFISEYGVDPANVHLLGHSLGSHVSGYAGEKIKNLGRISGLDPAGPYYTSTPSFIRLDDTDAVYVDNIHTDADSILMLGYGTEQAMGNVDFYPNSGHDQPGCIPVTIALEFITDIPDGVRDLVACSHGRAYKLYTDSLYEPCPYTAHECFDYDSFELGRCATCNDDNSKCAHMGIHADEYTHKDRVNVRMYFDTDKVSPYCYYHYQLIVDTAHPKKAEDWVQGHLDVWLYGDNGNSIDKVRLTKNHERFDHGQPKYFMFTSHIDVSRVIRMEVHWAYDATLYDPGSYCFMMLCNRTLYIRSIRISSMEYTPEVNRIDHQKDLCTPGHDYTEVKTGHTNVLVWDETCAFNV